MKAVDGARGSWPAITPWRAMLAWAGSAAVLAPLAILVHELGHYLVGQALGLEGLQFHHASVSHAGWPADAPQWQRAALPAAGPLVTLAIVFASAVLATWRPSLAPFALALALGAGVRSVALGIGFLVVQLRHPGAVGDFDEFNAASALGLPPGLVVALNVAAIVAAWAWCIRRTPAGHRVAAVAVSAAGAAAGIALYMGLVGPALLP